MHKQLIKITGGVACVLTLAVLFSKFHSTPIEVTPMVDSGETLNREPASVPVISNEVYRFERKIDAVLGLGETKSKKPLADTVYRGHLFVDWSKITATSRTGRFSLEVKDVPEIPLFVEAEISKDFVILSLKEPRTTNEKEEDALLFLKDLISIYAFQSTVDTTGKYEAKFTQSSGGVLLKSKLHYLESKLAGIQFTKSIHEIKLGVVDAQGYPTLEQLTGLENIQMSSAHGGPEFKTHSFYLLKNVSWKEFTGKKPIASSSVQLIATTMETSIPSDQGAKISWESVKEKLELVATLTGKERLDLFHELVKGIKGNPDKLGDFMEWARANMGDPQKASMAIGLLASVGSVETQQALVKLYQGFVGTPGQDQLAHLVLNGLTTSEAKLTPETRDFLNGILAANDNPTMTVNAAYAIGAAIQKEPDSTQNSRDIGKLTELAEQTSDMNQKLVYLDAIGNSGSAAFIPVLSENFSSSDPLLREKAVFAMRFMNDERIPALLEQSMNDADVNVQIAAVKAIAYQQNHDTYSALLTNCVNTAQDKTLKDLCSQGVSNL